MLRILGILLALNFGWNAAAAGKGKAKTPARAEIRSGYGEYADAIAVYLNSKGQLVVIGTSQKINPTIKDYREDTDFYDVCYVGPANGVRDLLTALVDAANGDGDSWAELVSIKKNKAKDYTVVANITDEGGEREETFVFPICE